MKIFYTDTFTFPLPEKHSFPKDKYLLLRMRTSERLGDQPIDMQVPEPASDKAILRSHSEAYLRRLVKGDLAIYLDGADPLSVLCSIFVPSG